MHRHEVMEDQMGKRADIDDIIPIASVSFIINPEYPLLELHIVALVCSPSPLFSPSALAFVFPFLSVLPLLLTYPSLSFIEIGEPSALRTYRLRSCP